MFFVIKYPTEKDSKENEDEAHFKYVQIKLTKFVRNNKTKHILQIINISNTILYNQSLVEKKALEMINACVSHELRNPLNSIISQNLEKKFLYEELRGCHDSLNIDIVEKAKIDTLMK